MVGFPSAMGNIDEFIYPKTPPDPDIYHCAELGSLNLIRNIKNKFFCGNLLLLKQNLFDPFLQFEINDITKRQPQKV